MALHISGFNGGDNIGCGYHPSRPQVPPGRCGATKDEADAVGGCKAFKETPPSFELEALLQKFTQMRDEALERYQQAKTELDEARLPIPDLERNERALSEHLETQRTEREKLVAEAAGLKSLSTSEKAIIDDAEAALNTLEACNMEEPR